MVKSTSIKQLDIMQILVFLIIARLSCSALSNLPFMSIAFVFIYGVAFFIFFIFKNKINKNELILLISILAYVFIVLIKILLAGKSIFSTEAFNTYIIFFLTIIYMWEKRQSKLTRSVGFNVILFGLLFTYIYSIIVLYFDPNASRISAATSVLEKSPYDILNAVGSFDAVYGSLFVIALFLSMRKEETIKQNFKSKLLLDIIIILATIFILMASYATAIVLLFIVLVLHIGSINKKIAVITVICVIMMLIFHENIGEYIIKLSNVLDYSDTLKLKMNDFGYMVKYFETTGTYAGDDGRWQKMLDSLNTFLKYPIFGGYGQSDAILGGHSEFCDLLGKFGLVGFISIITYFVILYKDIKRNLSTKRKKIVLNIIFFLFIIVSILNPALYTLQVLPIILMISLSESYGSIKKQKNHNKRLYI